VLALECSCSIDIINRPYSFLLPVVMVSVGKQLSITFEEAAHQIHTVYDAMSTQVNQSAPPPHAAPTCPVHPRAQLAIGDLVG
jgi:hypothetical protein